MGLNEMLSRYAVRRAHVLVVEAPGEWLLRAHLEQEMNERGWRPGPTPADADVLAVCGTPGPELCEVIDRLWDQMPGPRVRVDLLDAAELSVALDLAVDGLGDIEYHRRDAADRPERPDITAEDHGDMDHGDMDHGDMDHGDMDHGDMDHGDMEMAPDGIPLAEGEDDRDGLEMDVLHLRLGPVLPHWPAGLVLRCTLAGDVITAAQGHLVDDPGADEVDPGPDDVGPGPDAEYVPSVGTAHPDARSLAVAWRWGNIARLLALAGWEDAVARARRIRDAQLSGGTPTETDASWQRPRRQVTRSRLLRWSLQGLRPLTADDLHAHGLPDHLAGDTYDRLLSMLDRAVGVAESADGSVPEPPVLSPDAVAAAVVGLDLAAARLVVASLDMPPLPAPKAVTRA